MQRILSEAEQRAADLLRVNRDKLDQLTEALLVHEELDTEEVDKVFAGVPIGELKKEPPKPEPVPERVPTPETVAAPGGEPAPKTGLAFGGA